MSTEAFTHDIVLRHSAKDKAVVRAVAERFQVAAMVLPFGLRISDFGLAQPCLSANAFDSDWAQLEGGTGGSGNLPFRDPLNRSAGSLRRATTPSSKAPWSDFIAATVAALGFVLFPVPTLGHSTLHDLRATARRMEGVARPDSAGTFPAQRGTVRAIPGPGRQP